MSWPKIPLGSTAVHDGLFVNRLADPEQALHDVREAHAWVTRELATAEAGSVREACLTEERMRLAAISWELKRLQA